MNTKIFNNVRTGDHLRREGEVYKVWDGPNFDGYYQCQRDSSNGELREVRITKDEYIRILDLPHL